MDDANYYQPNAPASSGTGSSDTPVQDTAKEAVQVEATPAEPVNVPITQVPDDKTEDKRDAPSEGAMIDAQANDPAEEQNPMDVYDNFVNRLISEFGYDKLEEPQKTKLIDSIKKRIENRVLRVLLTNLTQEQSDEIDKEVKGRGLKEEDIVKLLSEKAPNAAQTILTSLDDLYLEMKQENDAIWRAAQNQAGQ